AVDALARHSAGVPRIVNHLAEAALALAALRRAPLVDDGIVSAVAAARRGAPLPQAPAAAPPPAQASPDDIPVLTESVAGEHDEEPLDPLDAAATLTLLGDDLDEISAEIAAEMLAVDHALPGADASDEPPVAAEADGDHASTDSGDGNAPANAGANASAKAGTGNASANAGGGKTSASPPRAGGRPRRRASG